MMIKTKEALRIISIIVMIALLVLAIIGLYNPVLISTIQPYMLVSMVITMLVFFISIA